jgi:hypothetical protein
MRLGDELERFEAALVRLSPESAADLMPPATAEAFARLESAIVPFAIPNDVRALYEWHDGGSLTAFAGRRFLSIDDVIREREFLIDMVEEPPSWLPLFMDASGGRYFVEALHPDGSSEPGLWLKGKDYGPMWEYSGVHAMLRVLASAYDDRLIAVSRLDSGHRVFELTSEERFAATRRELDPGPRDHSGLRSFFPAMDWPSTWLASIGVDKSASLPTGDRATPIADLIDMSTDRPVTATIAGRITTVRSTADLFWITVDDGSGLAQVMFEGEHSRLLDYSMGEVEVDIEAGPTIVRPDGIRPDKHAGHPVTGLAVRMHEPKPH